MKQLLLVLAMLLPSPLLAQEPAWKAGAGKATITPEKLMWMSGYGARTKPAEGTLHDLWVKALMIEAKDGGKLLLLTFDLVGIDRDTSVEICQRLGKKFKLERDRIVLSFSHTHCGPMVGRNLRAMTDLDATQLKLIDEYAAFLPGRAEKAVEQAMANLAPAELSWGIGQATFAVNRRENKEPDVPMLKKEGKIKGPSDHDVPVLAVKDAKGAYKAIVFGYACHATVLGFYEWCGDYPGFAMLDVEKAHPGAIALFWAGCGGDQNPLPRRTVEHAKDYGGQLAKAVDAVLAKPMTPLAGALRANYTEIPLPFTDLPTREKIAEDALSKEHYIALRAKFLLEEIARRGPLKQTYPYPVQTVRLGKEIDWVALGGEVVVEYSLRLKKELTPGKTWVMGYANDVMAYIPSEKVLREGGYEGARAMIYYGQPSIWAPGVEEKVVEAVHQQVGKSRK